jgi:hypothetical protein
LRHINPEGKEKPHRGGRQSAKERKSLTAKDTKDAEEEEGEKSFTAEDAKVTKEYQ